MPLHQIIDRLALALALTSSTALVATHETAAAIAALALWPLTKAVITVLDVFFLFFTGRPLVRVSACKPTLPDAKLGRTAK